MFLVLRRIRQILIPYVSRIRQIDTNTGSNKLIQIPASKNLYEYRIRQIDADPGSATLEFFMQK